jgi:hypothetical protein
MRAGSLRRTPGPSAWTISAGILGSAGGLLGGIAAGHALTAHSCCREDPRTLATGMLGAVGSSAGVIIATHAATLLDHRNPRPQPPGVAEAIGGALIGGLAAAALSATSNETPHVNLIAAFAIGQGLFAVLIR